MKIKIVALILGTLALFSNSNTALSGSMGDYSISDETYTRAYNNKFEGEETLGWGTQLSTAWSRIGAAKTCAVPYDEKAVLQKLNAMNNVGDMIHKMNGIDFNASLSKKINGFCTNARKKEIEQFLQSF